MKKTIVVLLLLFLTTGAVARPTRAAHRRHRRVSRPCWNPVFPPSRDSLLRQNAEIDRLGIQRIQNDREMEDLIENGDLVPIPVSDHLQVDPRLPRNRRYVRPWTAMFLTDLSDTFYAQFRKPLMVDSAVRSAEVQRRLRRRNANAAPIEGETASSHLAGLTIDIARRPLTPAQVRFLEAQLLVLSARGLVEVIEERHQLCFHIMVSGRYGQPPEIEILPEAPPLTPTLRTIVLGN